MFVMCEAGLRKHTVPEFQDVDLLQVLHRANLRAVKRGVTGFHNFLQLVKGDVVGVKLNDLQRQILGATM